MFSLHSKQVVRSECKLPKSAGRPSLRLATEFFLTGLMRAGSHRIVLYLRFNVSVENTISVHVLDRLEQLIDVELDAGFGQVSRSSLDSLVKVHLHELEDEG